MDAAARAAERRMIMDRLARNAMLAKQAGMSYGQWKALQPIVTVEKQKIPEGWKTCKHCGKPFKPIQGKQFCDIYCRQKAYTARQREIQKNYMKKYRARKEEEHGQTEDVRHE